MREIESTLNISIDQALHGYKNGHGLISSSLKLSSESLRTMLVLSDMSGSSMIGGFESYLTGYPLQKDGVYALGKTWHAPEMNRPGCVWTHTLIIKNSDLAKIKDLSLLLGLFERPMTAGDIDSYKKKIMLENYAKNIFDRGTPLAFVNYEDLLKSIYLSPGPAILFASDAKIYEKAILDVWSQQWPRLRRNFSFCTGSISDRNSSLQTFDIQIMPLQKHREFSGKVEAGADEGSTFLEDSSLLGMLEDDLLDQSEGSFRKFLWSYGADIESGKSSILALVKIYKYMNELSTESFLAKNVIKILGENFKQKNDAARLKRSIFELFCHSNYGKCKDTDKKFLYQLSTTEYQKSFDFENIDISAKIKKMWNEDRHGTLDFISKLLSLDLNTIGQSILKSFASVVEINDIDYIGKEKPNVIYVLASLNPELLTDRRLWTVMVETQLSLLSEYIQDGKIEGKLHFDIFSAILSSGADVRATELIDIFGEPAIGYFMRWFDSNDKSIFPKAHLGWDREVRNNLGIVINWIENNNLLRDETIAFFLGFLNPLGKEIFDISPDTLLSFSSRDFKSLARNRRCDIRAFFLSLGFENVGRTPYIFISDSFQEVHDAARENMLSPANWRPLEKYLPELDWWREWDKCERLRRGLAKVFFERDWPVEYFLSAIRDEMTFIDVVGFLGRKSWGRKFLKKIKKSDALGSAGVEGYKIKALSVDHWWTTG